MYLENIKLFIFMFFLFLSLLPLCSGQFFGSKWNMVFMSLFKGIDGNTIWIEQGNSYGVYPIEFSNPEEDGKYKIHMLKK